MFLQIHHCPLGLDGRHGTVAQHASPDRCSCCYKATNHLDLWATCLRGTWKPPALVPRETRLLFLLFCISVWVELGGCKALCCWEGVQEVERWEFSSPKGGTDPCTTLGVGDGGRWHRGEQVGTWLGQAGAWHGGPCMVLAQPDERSSSLSQGAAKFCANQGIVSTALIGVAEDVHTAHAGCWRALQSNIAEDGTARAGRAKGAVMVRRGCTNSIPAGGSGNAASGH